MCTRVNAEFEFLRNPIRDASVGVAGHHGIDEAPEEAITLLRALFPEGFHTLVELLEELIAELALVHIARKYCSR